MRHIRDLIALKIIRLGLATFSKEGEKKFYNDIWSQLQLHWDKLEEARDAVQK